MTDLNPDALEAATKALYECEESLSGAEYVAAAVEAYLANLPQTPTDHTHAVTKARQRLNELEQSGVDTSPIDAALDALEASRPLTPSVDYKQWLELVNRALWQYDNTEGFDVRAVAMMLASQYTLTPETGDVRHFAPWGSVSASCGVEVGRGEAPESDRFTAKRDDTTCADCRDRFTGPETGDVREALARVIFEVSGEVRDGLWERLKANPGEVTTLSFLKADAILARFTLTSKGTPETDEGNR